MAEKKKGLAELKNTVGKFTKNLNTILDDTSSTADKVSSTMDKLTKAAKKTGEAAKNMGDNAVKALKDADLGTKAKLATEAAKEFGDSAVKALKDADLGTKAKQAGDGIVKVATKTKDVALSSAEKAQKAAIQVIDQNGNEEIDIEDLIILGLKMPGVKINRANFLEKELYKLYPEDVIEKAIATNPMTAGVKSEDVDKIANEVINYERNCVSGISAALGMPGGIAMAAAIPADIAQYYGYMLRATQKLLYLYGFPEVDMSEKGNKFDSETINILTICLGVMYGAAGANNALKAIAKALATGVEKKLLRAALTKGTIYPIVKSISSWFGKKMTKEVFAGFFSKSIPVLGGVIGGGITYLSFKPGCVKLQKSLQNTRLSNPNYNENTDDENVIDAEFEEVEDTELEE